MADFKAYPIKFIPVYKDYLWGGRSLERFGRKLPEGIVAESWEISTHSDGISVIANGEYAGMLFPDYLRAFGKMVMGTALADGGSGDFPLLIKWIDAHQKLSVQVHPDDEYAKTYENGQRGKNEMWYILAAEPGARIIYDVKPGTDRDSFARAVEAGRIGDCLQSLEVFPGDVIEIPAGVVHGLGAGILLTEIQQSSNLTYRIYDYDRRDAQGHTRPLHIAKALDVIKFNKAAGAEIKRNTVEDGLDDPSFHARIVSNPYFTVEKYRIGGEVEEQAQGERFYIWIVLDGSGSLEFGGAAMSVKAGDTFFIPATMGEYRMRGKMTGLRVELPG